MVAKKDKKFLCAYCLSPGNTTTYAINRAEARGWKLYCCKECSDAGQRYTVEEWRIAIAKRREYESEHRIKNKSLIKRACASWYKRKIKNPQFRIHHNAKRKQHYYQTERYRLIHRKNALIHMKNKYNQLTKKAMKKSLLLLFLIMVIACHKKDEPQPNSQNNPIDTSTSCILPSALHSGEWVVYSTQTTPSDPVNCNPFLSVIITPTTFGINGHIYPATYSLDGFTITTTTESGSGRGKYQVQVYDCDRILLTDGNVLSSHDYKYFLKKK